MKQQYYRFGIILFGWLAVLVPLICRTQSIQWTPETNWIQNIFPMFGLLAFSLLWLHSISGAFEPWLRKHVNFDVFVSRTATLILIAIILHPLLLLIDMRFSLQDTFLYYGKTAVWLGIIGWLLLISYDITKPFKKYAVVAKRWNSILIISNIGFVITFFHALKAGSDLQSGFLKYLFIFYGVTAIICLIWTYAIMPLMKKKESL